MKHERTVYRGRAQRRRRVRARIRGTAARPRLSVFRSNRFVSAQLIDDEVGKTVAHASSRELKERGTKAALAAAVGKLLAERAKKTGVTAVVFDRGSYRYHGRVKSLADAARKAGLVF